MCAFSLRFFFALRKKNRSALSKQTMEDFRKADPTFVNFQPRTCVEAIDLFTRHRKLGMRPDLFPECFVHCAKELPGDEVDKFARFIVNPTGDITKGDNAPTELDSQLERERRTLLLEAQRRDNNDDEKKPEPDALNA